MDEVKKLCTSLRRNAKEERVLFHYNGHGVPRPTVNGEIWVFNKVGAPPKVLGSPARVSLPQNVSAWEPGHGSRPPVAPLLSRPCLCGPGCGRAGQGGGPAVWRGPVGSSPCQRRGLGSRLEVPALVPAWRGTVWATLSVVALGCALPAGGRTRTVDTVSRVRRSLP